MKKKVGNVLKGALAVIIIAVLLWVCFWPKSIENVKTVSIPETELTVLESEETFYGIEEVSERTGYFLLGAQGDTLSFQWMPYENVHGVVYLMYKGVYDCRGDEPVLLMEHNRKVLGKAFQLQSGERKNEVFIKNLNTSRVYVYDYENKKLSGQ